MDAFRLEKAAKLLRVNNTVNIVGALVPNSDSTQRIQELKGIVTEPDDAIDEEFTSSNLNNIADLLAARVKRFVSCPGNTECFFLIHINQRETTVQVWHKSLYQKQKISMPKGCRS